MGDELGSMNKVLLHTKVCWFSNEYHFCDWVGSYTGSFFSCDTSHWKNSWHTSGYSDLGISHFPKNEWSELWFQENNWQFFVAKDKTFTFKWHQNFGKLMSAIVSMTTHGVLDCPKRLLNFPPLSYMHVCKAEFSSCHSTKTTQHRK